MRETPAPRSEVIAFLRGLLGETFPIRNGEDFSADYKGTIWTSNECTCTALDGFTIFDCYGQHPTHRYDVHPKVEQGLKELDWYVEPYDNGTLMVCPM